MQRITADFIRRILLLPHYRKAIDIYTNKGIVLENLDESGISGKVFDGQWYRTSVLFNGSETKYQCSCGGELPCAHCGALLFQALRILKEKKDEEDKPGKPVFSFWQSYFNDAKALKEITDYKKLTQKWIPIFSLSFEGRTIRVVTRYGYVRRDGVLGRWRYLQNPKEDFPRLVKIHALEQIFNLMKTHGKQEENAYYLSDPFVNGYILDLMSSAPLFLENEEVFSRPLSVGRHGEYSLKFILDKRGGNIHITGQVESEKGKIPLSKSTIILSQFPVYIFIEDKLIRLSNIERMDIIKPLVNNPDEGIVIKNEELPLFWEEYFPGIPFRDDFAISNELIGSRRGEITGKKLYITEDNHHLYFSLYFSYGDIDIRFSSGTTQVYNEKTGELISIDRDWESERKAVELLHHYYLEPGKIKGEFKLARTTNPLDWMFDCLPKIAARGFTVLGEEKLKNFRINRNNPTVSLKVNSGIDWFDLEMAVRFGEETLKGAVFINAVADGRKYVELASGNKVRIPEEWFARFGNAAKLFSATGEKIKIKPYQIPLLDANKKLFNKYDLDDKVIKFKEKFDGLENSREEIEAPSGFKGELRPYQREGLNWIAKLHDIGIGGILADDMGLGKTIQVLAFIAMLKEKGLNAPILIVMPASLIFNWLKELRRFTPSVNVYVLAGSERANDITQIREYDVILTTYGILRRDWFWLSKQLFSVIVLDESQNIKNPLSQTFKSVLKLKSRFRLALSGTPIENTTIDLWSQMTFLNPGLLGNLHWFRRAFAIPIERENDKHKLNILNRLIQPLVLRRKKEDVAGELPPKVEQVILCSMTEAQEKYYENVSADYRNRLFREFDAVGTNGIKLRIIEYLTRVRQICNHPKMIDPELEMESGKMMTLMNLIRDITSEGYKVLVFSQFVKMLTLVKKELDREKITYQYLDGSSRNREQSVNEFQNNPEYQVFLISIKAGGLGLNLTAAEYVIQIDPWWNPAVEDQATDRAHRIGQDKKVFVYKLITHGTVEEKILKLQERKKRVSAHIIDSEVNLLKTLSGKELLELFLYDK